MKIARAIQKLVIFFFPVKFTYTHISYCISEIMSQPKVKLRILDKLKMDSAKRGKALLSIFFANIFDVINGNFFKWHVATVHSSIGSYIVSSP